ncbi:MAG: glycine/betaine ABC transporter substrate-binding protein [Firmicutes bacterium]|nr:glycine/betaine ABC transporter substrate-binding protein [Bacillota bacterium]
MNKKLLLIISLLAVSLLALAGCGGGDETANSGDAEKGTIVVGSKNFNENILLGEIMAQLIENKMDVNVERKLNLGGTLVSFQALKKGDLDLYADYTGTGLMAILKQPVETDPDKVYNIVQKAYNEQHNIKWLKPFGFNNTYTLAVREETADKYNLETYSDLAEVSNELTFGTDQEFINREDGLKGLKEVYGMDFDAEKAMEIALRYQAIANKQIDATNAFATDGELIKYNLSILEDDKNFFPPYYCAPTVNMDSLEKYPQLEETLNLLAGQINDQEMQQLNYLVAVEGKTKEEVAEQFLKDKDLI